MEIHKDVYKDLMEEDGTYGASGVLLVHSQVGRSGGGIYKMDRLCVWVEMWEKMFVLMSALI